MTGRAPPAIKALVTGFDAFGGDAINPSYEAVRRLPPSIAMRGGTLSVVTAELPTSFTRAARRLRMLIAREQPAIVLCVGLAAERDVTSVERVAVNLSHARIADNDGRRPVNRPVIARGPDAYFSTLPVMNIVKALGRAGIRAEMSMSAGTFVCNHVFYSLMHAAALTGCGRPIQAAGFVHVPALPPQRPQAALADMVSALQVVLRVSARPLVPGLTRAR